MAPEQVLGIAILLGAALVGLDHSKGRIAQWLFTPKLRIKVLKRERATEWRTNDADRPRAIHAAIHIPSARPMDRQNFAASHRGTVIDMASRRAL